jgi:pimeloyl-ACP methyl ester carboxylesterase
MRDHPETQFAWNGDAAIAYQVLGEGQPDLVYLQGWISNLELNWEHPIVERFLRGLARSRRLIIVDPRGTGVTERCSPADVASLETIMGDIAVVLDAVGSSAAAIPRDERLGMVANMFAATYPERTLGVIVFEASANWLWTAETPWEWTEERFAEQEDWARRAWSRAAAREDVRESMPSLADDHGFVEWWYRYLLLSAAPGYAIAVSRKYMRTDIRPILPSIHVPVLVLYRPGNPEPSWEPSARYLADHIVGAKLRELPGSDSYIWTGDQAAVLRAVDEFLEAMRLELAELDRVLATVLFVDVVASTEAVVAFGDHRWRELLERHRAMVRALLARYRGTEVDTAGDGFFATFDGQHAIRCARAIAAGRKPWGSRCGLASTGEWVRRQEGRRHRSHIGARVGAGEPLWCWFADGRDLVAAPASRSRTWRARSGDSRSMAPLPGCRPPDGGAEKLWEAQRDRGRSVWFCSVPCRRPTGGPPRTSTRSVSTGSRPRCARAPRGTGARSTAPGTRLTAPPSTRSPADDAQAPTRSSTSGDRRRPAGRDSRGRRRRARGPRQRPVA